MIQLSVIIPTHNRHEKLTATIACLQGQTLAREMYEIIVVDDGSVPPVLLPANTKCKLVRTEGIERSAARNAGAARAQGKLLVFVDDDVSVNTEFLASHLQAHHEWPQTLLVGKITLPDQSLKTPFGHFRQQLEQSGVPMKRGLTKMPNFCTAQNMSITYEQFQKLSGFEPGIVSSEDQDLALRFTDTGGQIGFVPEAEGLHFDSALDIRNYCRRSEWGSENMIPFCRRYPDWPDNIERERVNGLIRWGQEPFIQSLRKLLKLIFAFRFIVALLFGLASLLERFAPQSKTLDRVYRLLLGAHILRGYRKGLRRFGLVADANKDIARPLAATSYGIQENVFPRSHTKQHEEEKDFLTGSG